MGEDCVQAGQLGGRAAVRRGCGYGAYAAAAMLPAGAWAPGELPGQTGSRHAEGRHGRG
jgi:hypothetical protein